MDWSLVWSNLSKNCTKIRILECLALRVFASGRQRTQKSSLLWRASWGEGLWGWKRKVRDRERERVWKEYNEAWILFTLFLVEHNQEGRGCINFPTKIRLLPNLVKLQEAKNFGEIYLENSSEWIWQKYNVIQIN